LGFDPTAIWGAWAPDLTYEPIDAGHFMAEEVPAAVTDFIRRLLARSSSVEQGGAPRGAIGSVRGCRGEGSTASRSGRSDRRG
jgi:hypothetical protein